MERTWKTVPSRVWVDSERKVDDASYHESDGEGDGEAAFVVDMGLQELASGDLLAGTCGARAGGGLGARRDA